MVINLDIYISKFILYKSICLDYNTYNIIVDIDKKYFIKNIKFLFLNLLYPLYINNKKFNIKYNFEISMITFNINYLYMHTDMNIVDIYLYLESWFRLNKNIVLVSKYSYKLDNLNKYQLKAVMHINGAFRLLAPAGSGKTKTLINRILNLLNNGIDPSNILVLAFNKKAEVEINERLEKYLIGGIEIRTFHSFCNKIIKENTNLDFNIDEIDLINEEILDNLGIKDNEKYIKLVSKIKNNILSKDELNTNDFNIFNDYIKALIKEEVYGYDDMIYLCIKIILENGNLRNNLQNKYKYILVDEAQDLNNSQFLLIRILSLPENNIFMVGDDDQTIYTFRGANIDNLLNFGKYYPCYKQEVLKINYRSKANIVNCSKNFIDNNKNRIYKDIVPFNKEDGSIKLEICKNIIDECEVIVKWIKNLIEENNNYSDIAILYRHHEYEDILLLKLIVNDIPVNLDNNYLSTLFDVLLPYFNYFFDSKDVNYKKILDTQKIYINNLELKKLKSNRKFLNLLKHRKKKLYFKFKIMKKLLKFSDIKFIKFIRFLNLNIYLKDVIFNHDKFLMNNLYKALNKLSGIKEIYNMYINNKNYIEKSDDSINFSTIHKTKGNEFKNVCYFHLMTPKDNIEDERKISYVAFSRAKDNLFITTLKDDEMLFIKEFLNKKTN